MTKISGYNPLSVVRPDDLLPIVDVHDTTMASTGTTKNITVSSLLGLAPSGDSTGVNDTANVQGLLNLAAPGATVALRPGTWYQNVPWVIPPQVTLVGSGSWRLDSTTCEIIATSSFSGAAMILLVDQTTGGYSIPSNSQAILNLYLNGSNLSGSIDGIQGQGFVHGVRIENVEIYKAPAHGISIVSNSSGSPYSWRGAWVTANTCGTHGFSLAMTDCTWYHLEAIGNGQYGFSLAGSPSNSHFDSCRAEWNGLDGYSLSGTWGSGTGSGGVLFTGCSTDRNANNGMNVTATGTVPVIINGLMLRRDGRNGGTGGGSYAGFSATSASIPVIVNGISVFPGVDDNGTATLSPEYGVSFSGSTYVQILSGYIQGATAGINGTVSGSQLIAPNVIVANGSTGGPSTQLTDFYRVSSGIIQSDNDIQLVSGWITAQRFNASGITGATAASRYVGATTSGPPTSGTFLTGDFVIDQSGYMWICTAGGTPGTWVGDAQHAQGWQPTDSGWLAQNFDPGLISGSGTAASGTIQAIRVNVRNPMPVTNVILFQAAAGTGLTTGQNLVGLYSSTGMQIGVTADQTTNWGSGTDVFKTMALTGGPFTVSPPYVWVMPLPVEASGTTPSWGRYQDFTSSTSNPNLATSAARWATGATGATALPASFTPSSYLTMAQRQYWAALS